MKIMIIIKTGTGMHLSGSCMTTASVLMSFWHSEPSSVTVPRCAEWDEDEDEPENWAYADLQCLVPPASLFSGALSLPCADPADTSKAPMASAAEDSAVSTGGSDSHEDGAGKPGSDSAGSHGNELVEGDEYEDVLKEDPDAWPHRPGQYYHAACIMSSHRQLGIASLAMAQELILETRCTIP